MPARPRLRRLLPRLRGAGRALRLPQSLSSSPPHRSKRPIRNRLPVHRASGGARLPTSPPSRRSTTPLLLPRPKSLRQSKRPTPPPPLRRRRPLPIRRLPDMQLPSAPPLLRQPRPFPSRLRRARVDLRRPLLLLFAKRRQRVPRRLPAHRRRSPRCRSRMPARPRVPLQARHPPVRRCALRRPVSRIDRVQPGQGSRRVAVPDRVAASVVRVRLPRPRHRSVGRRFAPPPAVPHVPVDRRRPVVRRARVVIRVVVVARRGSVGRSIRLPSTRTSRRR